MKKRRTAELNQEESLNISIQKITPDDSSLPPFTGNGLQLEREACFNHLTRGSFINGDRLTQRVGGSNAPPDEKCSYRVWSDAVLNEARELFLVGVLILLHQVRHVVGHVHAHDMFAVNLCVELFALCIITGEALETARGGRGSSDLRTKSGTTKSRRFFPG